MKVLIWIGCIFASAIALFIINLLLAPANLQLGSIPRAIVVFAFISLAKHLSDKWYYHKVVKKVSNSRGATKICRNCGAALTEEHEFCAKCGSEVLTSTDSPAQRAANREFCKKCGANIANDTDTCHICGREIIRY